MNENQSAYPIELASNSYIPFKVQTKLTITKLKSYFTGILMLGGLALVLAACGGGGGIGSVLSSSAASLQAAFSGSAVDAPIAHAQITFTAGAPLDDTGATTIGTIVANASGVFTSTVTLPSADAPIFANATDPKNSTVVLSSYLGQSTALSAAAASGVLNSSNLPDLDITPVTTAALAVYAQVNAVSGVISYTNLSPSTYASNLQQYNGDILAIAAAIKAVGDNLCAPSTTFTSTLTTTTNLAASIAAQSSLITANSTTLATAASILGGNCATVLATLPQQISADPKFSPGLYLGDVIDEGVSGVVSSVSGGTYTLEGVIEESGWNSSASAVSANPASVFNDTTVTVDSSGNITSTDTNVSGTLVGNLINLTINNGSQTYSLRGKLGVIQSTLVSGGTAYSAQGGGTNTSTNVLTHFTAALVPAGVSPVWNGNTAPTSTTCASGAFPVQLNAYGLGIGGGAVLECVVPSATGWSMTASTSSVPYMHDSPTNSPPSLAATTWSELSSTPFILSASNASFSSNGSSATGTLYYVMGTTSVVFASNLGNSLFNMNWNALTHITETNENASSSVQGNSGNTPASGSADNPGNNGNSMHNFFH